MQTPRGEEDKKKDKTVVENIFTRKKKPDMFVFEAVRVDEFVWRTASKKHLETHNK